MRGSTVRQRRFLRRRRRTCRRGIAFSIENDFSGSTRGGSSGARSTINRSSAAIARDAERVSDLSFRSGASVYQRRRGHFPWETTCKIHDKTTIVGLTAGAQPALTIGDHTDLATPISIFVGREVSIGSNCIIGGTLIADNPGHRKEYRDRLRLRVEPEKIGRVVIEDHVWMAQYSVIIGDVTIGTGTRSSERRRSSTRRTAPLRRRGRSRADRRKTPSSEEMIDVIGEKGLRLYEARTIRS